MNTSSRRRRSRRKPTIPKSTVFAAVGLLLIGNEAVFQEKSDPWILGVSLLLCGFPVAELADLLRNGGVLDSEGEGGEDGEGS